MKKRAIIIGAGPAGLTAAYCLLKQAPGIQPVILEETNEIGGISRTVSHDGNRMDLGGHRFFSKSREVMEFWKEHMPGFPLWTINFCIPPKNTSPAVLIRKQRTAYCCFGTDFHAFFI